MEIKLTKNKVALIDDTWSHLAQHKWQFHPNGYAKTRVYFPPKPKQSVYVYMHHAIMGRPLRGLEVDHINGNGLDNRQSNLRLVTHRQNNSNNKCHRSGLKTSRYVGVSRVNGWWYAHINKNGRSTHIGIFKDEELAHLAYQRERKKIEESVSTF